MTPDEVLAAMEEHALSVMGPTGYGVNVKPEHLWAAMSGTREIMGFGPTPTAAVMNALKINKPEPAIDDDDDWLK